MKVLWELGDIRGGTKIRKPIPDRDFVNFIIAKYFNVPNGTVWGIFHVTDGEFIKVGNGSQEAVVVHLNNCGFKPLEE